jgi:MoxR-like ATPase
MTTEHDHSLPEQDPDTSAKAPQQTSVPQEEVATPTANITQECIAKIKGEIHKVIVGMDDVIEETVAAILINGHVLFEGFPGVAKTLLVKLVARSISVDFKRIQFTPDLMPSDVVGTVVFNQSEGSFSFHRGPVFSNIVLIDEINRAPAKTQSSLFEVMEERQVTIEGETHPLDYPFLVIGTQNPIDQEGTYRLPEAQLDRFVFKINIPYPSMEEEQAILERFKSDFDQQVVDDVNAVLSAEDIKKCERFIQEVHIEPQLIAYITKITQATRNRESIYLGASPRASIAIMKASKAFAAFAGRSYVKPDDVQRACIPVLNHRIILSASAEIEGYTTVDIIKVILEEIEIPR